MLQGRRPKVTMQGHKDWNSLSLRKLMILVLQKSPEGVPKICKMLLLVLYQ